MIGDSVKEYCSEIAIQSMEPRSEAKCSSSIRLDVAQEVYQDIDHSGGDELSSENRVIDAGKYKPSHAPYSLTVVPCSLWFGTVISIPGTGTTLRVCSARCSSRARPPASGQAASPNPILE